MKYIKTFEEIHIEIKKYIVWHYEQYDILHPTQYDNNRIFVERCLIYRDCKFKDEEKISGWVDISSPHILFSSDDLEECKKFIELKTTQDKYNL